METVNATLRRVPVWLVYVIGLLPAPWFVWLGATGGLGVEPIAALEHELGQLALQLLILGLAVTPLRRHLGLNLMKFRRAIGVLCFAYVVLHLMVWLVLDLQTLDRVWADIVKRPYITIGFAAFLLLLPLAVTSNNRSVRLLGAGWRNLHKLVYPAAILAVVHFVMLRKGIQLEPLLYLTAILVLLLLRLPRLPRLWFVSGV
ncbi:protein-methionine-sulfoxide reductase heme-binding subunit MsrQ [Lutimaribacter marinistellae]|uniref:Protein-methionine-sulfoxide reductase heme-binding subunit MsrQ n=1 Tax=Lutimaribacter marinistellae TaxID=1820329 RepID=A0ABV7TIB4_9RHOB